MTTELIFEEPPTPQGGRAAGSSGIGRWLASLRQHSGVWVKYPEPWAKITTASSTGTNISKARAYGVKPGEFETACRTIDGKTWLFARYVGGDQ